ncbi:tetratricopeptide repeat protein [Azonexus sp. IMCC34842]|uniref:tetratricopeptide repeat protein n=1 Tax=Azonexus sp. IMCC34842 TaxID=3420950 RepID=UPI003D0E333E
MEPKDLLEQAKRHPYIVAVALAACLAVGGFTAVAYMKISEARLGVREEKIGVLDERLKLQEDSSKRQRHINKLVQEQIGTLRKGFDSLPPAVTGMRAALSDAERSGGLRKNMRGRLNSSLQSVEQQLVVLQAAIANSEALSKSLDLLVSGVVAEEGTQFSEAAGFYQQAANAGVVDAQARLARLYLEGKGVKKNVDLAARLYERSALLGDLNAKDKVVKLYYSGDGVQQNTIRAAALLSVQPSSEAQQLTLASITREFDSAEKKKVIEMIESLRKTQAAIVQHGANASIEELKEKQ